MYQLVMLLLIGDCHLMVQINNDAICVHVSAVVIIHARQTILVPIFNVLPRELRNNPCL